MSEWDGVVRIIDEIIRKAVDAKARSILSEALAARHRRLHGCGRPN